MVACDGPGVERHRVRLQIDLDGLSAAQLVARNAPAVDEDVDATTRPFDARVDRPGRQQLQLDPRSGRTDHYADAGRLTLDEQQLRIRELSPNGFGKPVRAQSPVGLLKLSGSADELGRELGDDHVDASEMGVDGAGSRGEECPRQDSNLRPTD